MAINDIQYADRFKPDFGFDWIPPKSKLDLENLTEDKIRRYAANRAEFEKNALNNPVGQGWNMPMWKKVMENWSKYSIHVVLGGNQCVRGDTLIYDPVLNIERRIDSIKAPHWVEAWDGEKIVIAKADPAFPKDEGEMFRVKLSNGKSFVASGEHLVLDHRERWAFVWDLSKDDVLFGYSIAPSCKEMMNSGIYTYSDTAHLGSGKHQADAIRVIDITREERAMKWDITVPVHGNYIQSEIVHHNSSKSTLGSRLTVWAGATIPQAEVYCWHVSEKRSIDDQQRLVWEALPSGVKGLPTKKGINHALQYTQKNGFTDGICILPPLPNCRRGGSINFFNYQQYAQNDQIIEGVKAHFMWADEVIPLPLMDTLKYRLMTYHGRLLLTFTVINGWNDTIQNILAKTRTIEKRRCEREKIDLPIIQESLSVDSCCIYYFWSEDNPFTSMDEFWRLNATADRATILARAYGIPNKSIASIFPGFNREVNVIKHEDLPFIKNPDYSTTRYMSIDPAGRKNWFMLWVAIDAAGTWWVYREWPDYDNWALPGNNLEGKPGPAQRGSKKGIKDYVELIRESEKGETIYERFIDPRMGAAEKQSEDGATTIISDLDDQEMTVIPAPGVDIENGIQLINNLLAYDENKTIDSMNAPKLYISDRCQNLIYSMSEYTGKGGKDEASKDPCDALRYIAVSNPEHYGDSDFTPQNRTFSY